MNIRDMFIRDTVGVYDQAEFADNPEARCSIVLILDVSDSMAGAKIDTVNRALVKFRDIIKADSVTALRADVAVVEFDDKARVIQDFTNGMDFEPPTLVVKGGTNYSKAVNLALDIVEARKQSYRDGGIAYYRSLAYFLTDGCPMHDDPDDLAQAAARLVAAEENRSVAFFAFLVSHGEIDEGFVDTDELARAVGASYEDIYRVAAVGTTGSGADSMAYLDWGKVASMAGMSYQDFAELVENEITRTPLGELNKLSPRPPVELTNMAQLDGSIQWLSRSVAAVSQSQPGDSIRLPPTDYLNF